MSKEMYFMIPNNPDKTEFIAIKRSQIMTFNKLPIHSVFIWGEGCKFLKLKDAEVGVGMSKQPTNCLNLQNLHYCTMTSKHSCVLLSQQS